MSHIVSEVDLGRHRRDGVFGNFDPNAFNSQIGANFNPNAFGGSMSGSSGTSSGGGSGKCVHIIILLNFVSNYT